MDRPVAYGKYAKRGGNIYRTSTYIQWGESAKSLGACLLLNPGSATLEKNLINRLDTCGSASGRIKSEDPTMGQLINLIERIYRESKPISGRLYIYNLFNLQNPNSNKAVDEFEQLVDSGMYDVKESLVSSNELTSHPWILLGWGVEYKAKWRNLKIIKNKWKDLILQSKIPTFGKKHQDRDDYYHPCPLIPTKRPLMLNDLLNIYLEKVEKRTYIEMLNRKRYSILRWNGEYGNEGMFIVRDNFTGKQSLLKRGDCQSVFWFYSDLANDKSVSDWEDCDNGSYDDLETIAY